MEPTDGAHVLAALAAVRERAEPDATAQPVSLAGGPQLSVDALEARSNRLARGLAQLGIGRPSRVAVLCCDGHALDGLVGYLAVHKCGAQALVVPVSAHGAVPASASSMVAHVVLACAHVSLPHGAFKSARVIGDAPRVLWWKSFELRQSPHPMPGISSPQPDVWVDDELVPRVEVVEVTGWSTSADLVTALPFSHPVGLAAALQAVAAGRRVVLHRPFSPSRFARAIAGGASGLLLASDADELAQWARDTSDDHVIQNALAVGAAC